MPRTPAASRIATPAAQPANFIYLASQSPRRRQLLDQLGVKHELLLPEPGEDAEALEAERAGESPEDYVCRVTRAKLQAARRRLLRLGLAPAPILCADTTVALRRRILGKPADAAEAVRTLQALSGRSHRVLTAVALARSPGGSRIALALNTTHVRFAELPPALVRRYVASGEPFGKAGAYAVQGPLAGWVSQLRGSHSGVMGLPLAETAALLVAAGVPTALL